LGLLHPLSLLFEYVFVWVRRRVQELLQVVFCAHRSIIQVSVVKVLVPVFRDKDTPHAGSYFSTYCTVPALPCATLIASSLVLRFHADRPGIVATSSNNPDYKITTPLPLYFQFITSYYMFRSIVRQSSGRKKMQVQKVHPSSPISSMLLMKDFTAFTAPFEMDFRYML